MLRFWGMLVSPAASLHCLCTCQMRSVPERRGKRVRGGERPSSPPPRSSSSSHPWSPTHSGPVQKKTCGSTVFSPGHPRQYSLAPAMLNFADRTRRGVFMAVWPQMREEGLCWEHVPPFLFSTIIPHLLQCCCAVACFPLQGFEFCWGS